MLCGLQLSASNALAKWMQCSATNNVLGEILYREYEVIDVDIYRISDEKEAKKEGFRKYLESSGAIDALTKVLVSLYEQNDKPSSAIEFIQQRLGGPTVSDYEKIQAEMTDLQIRYNELLASHQEKCRELEELRKSHIVASYEEGAGSVNDPQEEKHELF